MGTSAGWRQGLAGNVHAGTAVADYTSNQMTYDLRWLRLKGLVYQSPGPIVPSSPVRLEVARLFSRLEARVFRPATMMFTSNDAVAALDRVDAQLDLLIYEA